MLVALVAISLGCSSGNGVAPDNRGSMEEFFTNLKIDDSTAGYFSVADLEGNVICEGTLVRDENGKLAMGETRNGEITIDLTWMGWVDCSVNYLNPAGYTPDGRSLYYIGTTMDYELNVNNYANNVCCATVVTEQRYLGGPLDGELLPGDSTEKWTDVLLLHGLTVLPDDYYIPYGTIPGNDVTWARVSFSFNIWCLKFDIILYDCAAGLWDP